MGVVHSYWYKTLAARDCTIEMQSTFAKQDLTITCNAISHVALLALACEASNGVRTICIHMAIVFLILTFINI